VKGGCHARSRLGCLTLSLACGSGTRSREGGRRRNRTTADGRLTRLGPPAGTRAGTAQRAIPTLQNEPIQSLALFAPAGLLDTASGARIHLAGLLQVVNGYKRCEWPVCLRTLKRLKPEDGHTPGTGSTARREMMRLAEGATGSKAVSHPRRAGLPPHSKWRVRRRVVVGEFQAFSPAGSANGRAPTGLQSGAGAGCARGEDGGALGAWRGR